MAEYVDDEVNFGDWSSLEINVARRVPICLVLDRSGSMVECDGSELSKIQELNNNMKNFLDYVRGNAKASRICDICIISFGGVDEVIVENGYSNIKDLKYKPLVPYGRTPIGAAVAKAMDLLKLRRNYYRNNDIEHYKPIMLLMTDGLPTDNYMPAAQEFARMVKNKEVKVFPVGIGRNFNKEVLRQFSPLVEPKTIDSAENFAKLFKLLSASSSNPNDDSLDKWFMDEA